MLSLRSGFTPHCNTLPQNPIQKPVLFNPTHIRLCFFTNRVTRLGFNGFHGQIRTGSCASALKKARNGGNSNTLLETEDIDLDEHGDDEVQEFEDYDENDDEGVVIPLKNMKQWLQNRPRGFGEGREYDTSVEDKLFEDMEQSRLAQLANINKLKNSPELFTSKKEKLQSQKVSESVPSGVRVRLVNLPKKKNIHRDLQLAFKGVPGILNIIPAVLGNKKTREPICKGIAFVDFKFEDEANRFVEIFSRQSITFGKIQKQIKYEIVDLSSQNPAYKLLVDRPDRTPRLAVLSLGKNLNADTDMETLPLDSPEEKIAGEHDSADDVDASVALEDDEAKLDVFHVADPQSNSSGEQRKGTKSNSPSSKQQVKISANGKKPMPKRKGPKLNIPGSAKSLRIKEKALLTGVFSKYGVRPASAVTEKS
ncbi:hypothetical protein RJ639_027315 [Escallonia herrerae]|uniref:RRM domain-containing protein n=1 Tax=Escallonia herrerae TaxID=1293975 RepID=A0AA88X2E5_9ASTE|nr:hypothetical protein RJ639_027315 [Escallonia herrerae]